MKITCSQIQKESLIEAMENYDKCPWVLDGCTITPCSDCYEQNIEWNIQDMIDYDTSEPVYTRHIQTPSKVWLFPFEN